MAETPYWALRNLHALHANGPVRVSRGVARGRQSSPSSSMAAWRSGTLSFLSTAAT